jgi:deazaflavin-dependent oxidoreductase (nitroreductase family)
VHPLLKAAATQTQNAVTAAHRAAYRATGGRVGGSFGRLHMLLLTTTGARTGNKRVQPLLYTMDGERYVLIASNGGAPRHPAWFLNLRAHPLAEVQVGGRVVRVRAREAKQEERERLWQQMAAVWPLYNGYQHRADRQIPVVLLEPTTN